MVAFLIWIIITALLPRQSRGNCLQGKEQTSADAPKSGKLYVLDRGPTLKLFKANVKQKKHLFL